MICLSSIIIVGEFFRLATILKQYFGQTYIQNWKDIRARFLQINTLTIYTVKWGDSATFFRFFEKKLLNKQYFLPKNEMVYQLT